MDEPRTPVLLIDGTKTLPLFVMYMKTLETIGPFQSGKAAFAYRPPEYDIPPLAVSDETLNRLASDAAFAREVVRNWQNHASNFGYFIQFSDNRVSERSKALYSHTELVSLLCDSRLGIDPTSMWRYFDALITFQGIHSAYRQDPDRDSKWDVYAQRLATAHTSSDAVVTDTMRLVERISKQIDLKSANWSSLRPLLETAKAVKSTSELILFYCYAHEDESLRDKLDSHLSALRHQGVIHEWHDRRITGGQEWEGKIDEHLEVADIILLLISADFIASPYCYSVEMKRAMERHENHSARVIPVILRDCDWHKLPFARLQALPKDGKPIRRWSDLDAAFTDVAKGIRKAANELVGDEGSRKEGTTD